MKEKKIKISKNVEAIQREFILKLEENEVKVISVSVPIYVDKKSMLKIGEQFISHEYYFKGKLILRNMNQFANPYEIAKEVERRIEKDITTSILLDKAEKMGY